MQIEEGIPAFPNIPMLFLKHAHYCVCFWTCLEHFVIMPNKNMHGPVQDS